MSTVNPYLKLEQELIAKFKEEFKRRTGKALICKTVPEKQAMFFLDFKDDEKPDPDKLVDCICTGMGWNKEELMKKVRREDILQKRYIIYGLLKYNGVVFTKIAEYFGQDHTTVISGLEALDNWINLRYHFKNYVKECVDYIKENYQHCKD